MNISHIWKSGQMWQNSANTWTVGCRLEVFSPIFPYTFHRYLNAKFCCTVAASWHIFDHTKQRKLLIFWSISVVKTTSSVWMLDKCQKHWVCRQLFCRFSWVFWWSCTACELWSNDQQWKLHSDMDIPRYLLSKYIRQKQPWPNTHASLPLWWHDDRYKGYTCKIPSWKQTMMVMMIVDAMHLCLSSHSRCWFWSNFQEHFSNPCSASAASL